MLVLLVAVAVAVVVFTLIAIALARGRRFDDVERFHRARRMTTEWSRAGVTSPFVAPQATPDDAREPVER